MTVGRLVRAGRREPGDDVLRRRRPAADRVPGRGGGVDGRRAARPGRGRRLVGRGPAGRAQRRPPPRAQPADGRAAGVGRVPDRRPSRRSASRRRPAATTSTGRTAASPSSPSPTCPSSRTSIATKGETKSPTSSRCSISVNTAARSSRTASNAADDLLQDDDRLSRSASAPATTPAASICTSRAGRACWACRRR